MAILLRKMLTGCTCICEKNSSVVMAAVENRERAEGGDLIVALIDRKLNFRREFFHGDIAGY
ncbi:hypothetical protein SAMN05660860_00837 [Geoalkalibacter ferrihydriticus]|uniref:Uncharacterized protein n=2 Tax=Geoalkalibacter ferrihydriticus TaxID=392333 RepID=A0A0C2HPD9_9BACT|nr:hypothetical protein [Geoalkalibacter ferrihydriticus]KIH76775.1 hypothetical protein GFER_06505 [Geoalkalibacter ferrihydriticus DSM 17813]SDL52074.1 hypothetical protein SAMN05660860_00837 [Geoalkalibacter ferrihydriticus]